MFSDSPSTPGLQRADAAHHDLDRHAGLRRAVERVDDLLVDQRVALDPDPGVLPGPRQLDLLADRAHDAAADAVRRRQHRPVGVLPRVAGEHVEQVGDVRADARVGGEQADVLVEPRGLRVVVAGADVAVAADGRALLAHDQRHLAVRLQPDQAVDHVHARLLQRARPGDVGLLVEPRLDLDQRDDLLAGLGRVDQRVDDRRVAGGAVQRLLDREHLRVGRGLLDEPLHARGERVVRVVHEHVALAQRREDALRRLALAERRVRRRHERRVLQLLAVHAVQLAQAGQVEQAGHLDDVGRVDVHLAQQQLEHVVGHVLADLEAHRRAEPALGQLAFQGLQQVLVPVLLDLEVGVAGDAEDVALDDVHAGEQLAEVRGDQFLQRQERRRAAGAVGLDADQARHVVRHLDPGEVLGAALRVAHGDGQVERQAGDVGERVRRVDRQRREDREDLLGEVVGQPQLVGAGQVGPGDDADAVLGQLRAQVVQERAGVLLDQFLVALGDVVELLARGQPVRAAHRQAGLVAALQAGDPDHVELVQVGREDREELGPLQQRLRRVLGQREHAGVEVQPGQLAVEVAVVGQRLGGGRRVAVTAGGADGTARNSSAPRALPCAELRRRVVAGVAAGEVVLRVLALPAVARAAVSRAVDFDGTFLAVVLARGVAFFAVSEDPFAGFRRLRAAGVPPSSVLTAPILHYAGGIAQAAVKVR